AQSESPFRRCHRALSDSLSSPERARPLLLLPGLMQMYVKAALSDCHSGAHPGPLKPTHRILLDASEQYKLKALSALDSAEDLCSSEKCLKLIGFADKTSQKNCRMMTGYKSDLSFLRPEFVTGHGLSSEQSNQVAMSLSQQDRVLKQFAQENHRGRHERPACNLVVKFNFPPEFRSYVQSKGRARAVKSRYVMLVNEDEENDCKSKLVYYQWLDEAVQRSLLKMRAAFDAMSDEDSETLALAPSGVLAPLVLVRVLAPLVAACLWCWRLWCWRLLVLGASGAGASGAAASGASGAGALCWPSGAGLPLGAGASGAGASVLALGAGASGAGGLVLAPLVAGGSGAGASGAGAFGGWRLLVLAPLVTAAPLVLAPLVLAPLCWRLWCWRLWCWRLWCWALLAPLVLAPLVLAPLVLAGASWCWRLWLLAPLVRAPLCGASGAGASGAGASGLAPLVLASGAGASGAGASGLAPLVLAPLVLAPLVAGASVLASAGASGSWRLWCWRLSGGWRLWCWRLWCWRLWCWRPLPDESGATASTADASEGAAPLDLSVRSDHPLITKYTTRLASMGCTRPPSPYFDTALNPTSGRYRCRLFLPRPCPLCSRCSAGTICRSGGGAPPAQDGELDDHLLPSEREARCAVEELRSYEPGQGTRGRHALAAETRRQSQQLLSCHRAPDCLRQVAATATPQQQLHCSNCHRLDVKLPGLHLPPCDWQPALLTCGAPLPDSLAFPLFLDASRPKFRPETRPGAEADGGSTGPAVAAQAPLTRLMLAVARAWCR
uniref:ADF-H domain-containing protein n=1 Tax=Macrostomum lignano TaxID=282301 RepID=A0A1I8FQR4_9PLAT